MNELNLDSFEISIKSDIKGITPKPKKRGYAKELVEKLYLTIEDALADGCSYEQIAEVLKLRKIKITSSTLKRYHRANKKAKTADIQNPENSRSIKTSTDTTLNRSQSNSFANRDGSNKLSNTFLTPKVSTPMNKGNQIAVPDILSGSALTDEDYADDFNNY